ncbi:MAG: universal stress protein [Isosphaeraceae bacterium]
MSESRRPLPLFRTILVAEDFSEGSRAAFEVASALARDGTTRLVVLHVLELIELNQHPLHYGELGVPMPITPGDPFNMDAIRNRMAALNIPDHPVDVDYLIREGEPADEILGIAESEGAELIVMGTHGRTGLDRLLAGSVAESVMRRSSRPVLTVRVPAREAIAER